MYGLEIKPFIRKVIEDILPVRKQTFEIYGKNFDVKKRMNEESSDIGVRISKN